MPVRRPRKSVLVTSTTSPTPITRSESMTVPSPSHPIDMSSDTASDTSDTLIQEPAPASPSRSSKRSTKSSSSRRTRRTPSRTSSSRSSASSSRRPSNASDTILDVASPPRSRNVTFSEPPITSTTIVDGELIHINVDVLKYLNDRLHNSTPESSLQSSIFTKDALPMANRTVKHGNYYAIDKYGLVIRKSFRGSQRSEYGWEFNDNDEPVNVHVSSILIRTRSREDIQLTTLKLLKDRFPAAFRPNGLIRRVYSILYPHIDIDKL